MKSNYTPRYADETASSRGWVWYVVGAVIFLPLFYALGYYLIGPALMGRSNQPEAGSLAVVQSVNVPAPSAAPEPAATEGATNSPASAQPEPEVVITEEPPKEPQKAAAPPAATAPREVIVFPDRPARQERALRRNAARAAKPAREERASRPTESRSEEKAAEPASPSAPEKQEPRAASTAPEPATVKLYRVQVGVYTDKTTAKGVANDLSTKGYAPYVGPSAKGDRSRYKVQVGAFRDRAHAEKIANDLKEKGYEIYIAPEE
ncbi:MAG: SPOR domain-containing protein [Armatimonadetes bacterium]|nr:SPOR domain-containing protein [Armatimonadota bacterium]